MATAPPSFGVSSLPIPAMLPQPGPTPGEVLAPAVNDAASSVASAAQDTRATDKKIALIKYNQRQAADTSAAMVGWAQDLPNVRAQIASIRQSADFNPDTYGDQVRQLISDRIGQHLGNVADPEVRQRLAPVFNEWGADQIARARLEGAGAAADQLVLNTQQSGDRMAVNLSDHPEDRGWALVAFRTLVESNKNLPPDQQAKLVNHYASVFDEVAARSTIRQDPDKGAELLHSGFFDNLLPHQKEELDSFAETEQHKREVEARQAIEERRRDANTFIENLGKSVENHIPVADTDFDKAGQLLADKDLKLDGHAFDLVKWRAYNSYATAYQKATPVTMGGRLDALNAQIAREGNKVDPNIAFERNWLQERLPQRREEQRSDPLAMYAQGGGEVTPLNWADPASLQARVRQATMAQGRNGGPLAVLTRDEAAQFEQQLAQGGTAGRVNVVNMLAGGGPQFAVAAARQIAPKDQHLQTAAALAAMGPYGMANARDSILGADAMAAHKGIINERAFADVFSQAAKAFTGLTPDVQRGIYDTAMGLTATRLARLGQTGAWPTQAGNDAYQRKIASVEINEALGGSKRSDGSYAGGLGTHAGSPIVLPTTMTQTEFENAFARARPQDFEKAAGGVTPVYANGKPPTWGEFKKMVLVPVGQDGVYRLKLGNAYLGRSDGHGVYEFDANKLPH